MFAFVRYGFLYNGERIAVATLVNGASEVASTRVRYLHAPRYSVNMVPLATAFFGAPCSSCDRGIGLRQAFSQLVGVKNN